MAEEKTVVCIVDDDQFLLDMYAMKFKERGVEVQAFISAASVLTAIKEGLRPDLLITDIVMPEVDGIELLRSVKELELDPEPVTVVLSNQGQDYDIDQAKSLGADGYIIKANAIPSEVIEECMNILESNRP